MSLIRNAVRCAIAAAAAGAAANSASALDISTYNAATAVNVYLSGSTAVDNTLVNAAIETAAPGGLCQAGTVDIYYIGTTGSYSNRMIFCTGSASSGVSGSPLAIYKESTAGSQNGVTPLYTAASGGSSGLSFINPTLISDAACNGADGGAVAANGNFGAYTNHSSCPAADVTANVIPTAGFADVEPKILKTVTGGVVNSTLAGTYLKSGPTLDQIWAVALTKNAYYALQAAEGYTSPSDSPANAPSLSKQDVAGLISGNIFNWNDLGLNPVDTSVYICRRDFGSGTEASFEAYFLGERCSISSEAVPNEDAVTTWANASGGAMRTCLQHMFAGGTQTAYYSSASHTFPAGNQYAIGFLNDEITLKNLTGASDSFRLVAVDGVGPTVANVQNGYYPYFSTGLYFQIKTGTGVPTGTSATAATNLLKLLGHPQFTHDSNAGYNGGLPWSPTLSVGDSSPAPLYAASNPPTIPATSTTAAANPTNAYTKNQSGSINNCDTPVWDSGDLEGVQTTTVETKLLGNGQVND